MSQKNEQWGSRLGFILAAMGMAVGTGNIWRFPRMAGTNGGGTFILIYIIANLVWAAPLMITEIALGRKYKLGTAGAFREFMGRKYTWMGAWICWVCAAITFYYVVVFGQAMRYFVFGLQGTFKPGLDTQQLWDKFTSNPGQGILFLAIGTLITLYFGYRSVNKGLEALNKIAVPLLFVCLIIVFGWSLTLKGSGLGLKYLFVPNWSLFLSPVVWLAAFTQSAWSTGAGWGEMLTYGNYLKDDDDVACNGMMTVFGDQLGAMAGALAVLPVVFALSASPDAAVETLKAGNVGLTFIYLAKVFPTMPGGNFIAILFFLALSLAALTSLVAQMEVLIRNFVNAGFTRQKAALICCGATFVLGIPSAVSINFLNNQDWVWGIGLLVGGLFYSIGVYKYGVDKVRTELINKGSDIKLPKWFYNTCIRLFPVLFVLIVGWWVVQSISWHPTDWWKLISVDNVGTMVIQIVVSFAIFYFLNEKIAKKIQPADTDKNNAA